MKYRTLLTMAILSALLLSGCGGKEQPEQSAEPAVSAAASVFAEEIPEPEEVLPPEPVVTVTVDKTAEELMALPETGEWSWFDDAVFVGDSVTLKLKNFVSKQRQTMPE